MIYILHHSKGALLLNAHDRDQVIEWSRRQLGSKAGMVSVSERICTDAVNAVEKDGTGIEDGHNPGCHPIMGVTANTAQDVLREQGRFGHLNRSESGTRLKSAKITWH
jgi:hypothetical protein